MTYYDVLEVSQNASDDVIKVAYRALCKKYHPDINKEGDTDSLEMMKKVNEAFSILSDKEKRIKYDATLKQPEKQTNTYNSKQPEEQANSYDSKQPHQKDSDTYSADTSNVEHNYTYTSSSYSVISSILKIALLIIVVISLIIPLSYNKNLSKKNLKVQKIQLSMIEDVNLELFEKQFKSFKIYESKEKLEFTDGLKNGVLLYGKAIISSVFEGLALYTNNFNKHILWDIIWAIGGWFVLAFDIACKILIRIVISFIWMLIYSESLPFILGFLLTSVPIGYLLSEYID